MYDVDDDADGVCTAKELQDVKDLHFSLDTDGDGLYNYLDADDDNDGQLTLVEEKVWENNKITPYLYKAPNASDVQKTDYLTYTEQQGFTNYELTNHLGNVMAVITDAPEAQNNTLPTVKSYADYWPFGAPLSIASGAESYRYGFGGHENDPEPKGDGNFVDFGNYGLDVRIGRRWQQDPMAHTFPWESPYSTFFNNPVNIVDPTGLAGETVEDYVKNTKTGEVIWVDATGKEALKQASNKFGLTSVVANEPSKDVKIISSTFFTDGSDIKESSIQKASSISQISKIQNNYIKDLSNKLGIHQEDIISVINGKLKPLEEDQETASDKYLVGNIKSYAQFLFDKALNTDKKSFIPAKYKTVFFRSAYKLYDFATGEFMSTIPAGHGYHGQELTPTIQKKIKNIVDSRRKAKNLIDNQYLRMKILNHAF